MTPSESLFTWKFAGEAEKVMDEVFFERNLSSDESTLSFLTSLMTHIFSFDSSSAHGRHSSDEQSLQLLGVEYHLVSVS